MKKNYSRDLGDILKLTFLILDLGEMCHMTPQISDSIPCSLEYMDKYIEVTDVNYVMVENYSNWDYRTWWGH